MKYENVQIVGKVQSSWELFLSEVLSSLKKKGYGHLCQVPRIHKYDYSAKKQCIQGTKLVLPIWMEAKPNGCTVIKDLLVWQNGHFPCFSPLVKIQTGPSIGRGFQVPTGLHGCHPTPPPPFKWKVRHWYYQIKELLVMQTLTLV